VGADDYQVGLSFLCDPNDLHERNAAYDHLLLVFTCLEPLRSTHPSHHPRSSTYLQPDRPGLTGMYHSSSSDVLDDIEQNERR
jgi:hypothetical protein